LFSSFGETFLPKKSSFIEDFFFTKKKASFEPRYPCGNQFTHLIRDSPICSFFIEDFFLTRKKASDAVPDCAIPA